MSWAIGYPLALGSSNTVTAPPGPADSWARSWTARGNRAFGERVRGATDMYWAQTGSTVSNTNPVADTIWDPWAWGWTCRAPRAGMARCRTGTWVEVGSTQTDSNFTLDTVWDKMG